MKEKKIKINMFCAVVNRLRMAFIANILLNKGAGVLLPIQYRLLAQSWPRNRIPACRPAPDLSPLHCTRP